MSDNTLTDFQQQEAEITARLLQFNRWSQVLIERMIQEHEEKMMASDLPVDDDEVAVVVAGDVAVEPDDSEVDKDDQNAPVQPPVAGADERTARKQEEEMTASDLPVDDEEVEVVVADDVAVEPDDSEVDKDGQNTPIHPPVADADERTIREDEEPTASGDGDFRDDDFWGELA